MKAIPKINIEWSPVWDSFSPVVLIYDFINKVICKNIPNQWRFNICLPQIYTVTLWDCHVQKVDTRPKSFHSKMGTTRFRDLLSILLMAILLPSYFGEKHTPPNEPKYKLIWLRPRRPWHQIVYKMWRVI